MTPFQLSAADELVVAGYFLLLLLIGLWFRSRLHNMRDYFAGGNRIPWWMAGISHYMSSFSAFSFIAYAQIAYTWGWVAVTLFWAVVPACVAGGLVFARRWRRARILTPVQFLEARFNGFVRQLFAWSGIPVRIFDDALKIYATGLFVSVAAGMRLLDAILICGVVMVVYTFFGGVWALVVTDYVQFLMKVLAILLLCPLAVLAAGGWQRAFSGLPEGFLRPVHGPYGWPYLVGFSVLMLVSYNANWALAQKYYSVPTDRDASKAAYLSAFLNLVGAPLMILPAIVGRNILPNLVAEGRTADTYVLLVTHLLPAGMIGILMAAMFSATMATVTGDFNAVASVLTQDVYHRLLRPRADEAQLLRAGRWITFALGALTTLLSLWIGMSYQQSLFNLMVTVLGLFLTPTLLPLLAGLVSKRLNAGGATAGFAAGLVTGSGFLAVQSACPNVLQWFGSSYNFEGVSLMANCAATLAGMVFGSLWTARGVTSSKATEEFFVNMATPVRSEEAPATEKSDTAGVLGFATAFVAALLVAAGVISGATKARWIDTVVGIVLVMIALSFWMSAGRGRIRKGRARV